MRAATSIRDGSLGLRARPPGVIEAQLHGARRPLPRGSGGGLSRPAGATMPRVRHVGAVVLRAQPCTAPWGGDGYGATALREDIAARLRASVRRSDRVLSHGPDTFTIVLADVQRATHLEAVVRRLRAALAAPFVVGGQAVALQLDVQARLVAEIDNVDEPAPLDAQGPCIPAQPLPSAAGHCAASALAGLPRHGFGVRDLQRALSNGEFYLAFQPVVALNTGAVTAMEALLRWRHPQHGMITPGDFVPLAEESGFVVALGEWVLREACRQAAAWQRADAAPVAVAVNVSMCQLKEEGLVHAVAAALVRSGLPASLLQLELTETLPVHDFASAAAAIAQLKAVGVQVALDDFGTGYANLRHLKELPVDRVKVDRTLVQQLGEGERAGAAVQAVIQLAHALRLTVVAEGVERTSELDLLRGWGCDEAQGFLLGKPGSASDALPHLARNVVSLRDS